MNFRKKFLILSVSAMAFAGVAAAQQPQPCVGAANATSLPPELRAESTNELVTDLTFTCTGPNSLASGSVVAFLSGTVTSKQVGVLSEATLLVIQQGTTTTTTSYPGVVSGSQVVFGGTAGVTFPAGAYTLKVSNVRVNSSLLAVSTFVTEAVIISRNGVTAFTSNTINVGYVQQGFAVPSAGAVAGPYSICQGNNTTSFTLNLAENFGGAFKTQAPTKNTATGLTQLCGGAGCSQTNGEQGSYQGAGGVGTASSGTRFQLSFSSIPSGVALYLPTKVTGTGGSSALTMTLIASAAGVYSPVAAGVPAGSGLPANYAAIAGTNGAATAVYEVTGTDNTVLGENVSIPGILFFSANFARAAPAAPTVTVTPAPTGTVNVPTFAPSSNSAITLSGFAACQSPIFPGQGEVLTSPRSASAQPLLIPFVSNQGGFDTGITIANTSQDTLGSAAQSGTCTISFYGAGAPSPNTIAVPGTLAAGGSTNLLLSGVAPGFQGYVIVNCTFPLARGSARIVYNAGQVNSVTASEAAQVLTLPRSVSATQALLLPFVSNQQGIDTSIVIANTSTDPFGVFGATPTSGTCTLSFYGAGEPTPNTGVAVPGGTLASGATTAFPLSSVAPGFEGYVIAQCNFGAAAGFAYLASNLDTANGYAVSETPEAIALPRGSSPQPLLFSAVSNQNGDDTGISIANTSLDPFGTTPASGACTLNFYGASAPGSTSVNIPAGKLYTTTISSIAPGFKGYVTATCPFGPVRGFALVQGSVGANDYSVSPEVVPVPRSAATPSTLLFSSTTNVSGFDTSITIANTSQDSFGTTAASGACTINYFGTMSPVAQTSPNISAGSSWSFLLSQAAPGFSGYIIASCSFPLARGVAEILTPVSQAPISIPQFPPGTPPSLTFPTFRSRQSVSDVLTIVSASGSVPFTVAYATTSGGNWLSGPSSGTATPSGTSITVTANSLSLPLSGSPYMGTITISTAGTTGTQTRERIGRDGTGGGTSITVQVTLTLVGTALSAAPIVVNISVPAGQKSSLQTVTVTPAGFTATLTPKDGFLLLSPASGNLTLPAAFGVGVDATSLSPGGPYLSNIAVQCATCYDVNVAVTATVTGISSLNPPSATAGGPQFPLMVNGAGFVSGSTVEWNGSPVQTMYISATQLSASIPASLIASAGSASVTVFTVGAGVLTGLSNAVTFAINSPAGPAITSIDPPSATAGIPSLKVTIMGSGFVSGASVQWNGLPLSTNFVSATTLTALIPAGDLMSPGTGQITVANPTGPASTSVPFFVSPQSALQFLPAAPCRVMDTRDGIDPTNFPPNSTFGSPYITAGTARTIPIPASVHCPGVPANAAAYSLNFTVQPKTTSLGLGSLTVWPAGTAQPNVSTLSFLNPGQVLAAAGIVQAGAGGAINATATQDVDLIVDINGYFVPPDPDKGTLQFYTLPPLRCLDTRLPVVNSGTFPPNSTFGSPALDGVTARTFPIPSSTCGAPASAAAYSFNVGVQPPRGTPLYFLAAYPTGGMRPLVSTLNDAGGTILANAAIVPAGPGGAVNFYASNPTDFFVDINGYFAPPGPLGLNFYTVPPCRLVDTRNPNGTFGGPTFDAGTTRSFPLPASPCGIPSGTAAQAYSLSITVFPKGGLSYITTWPTGGQQPLVSTLNAFEGLPVANAALVPAGTTGGAINVFVTDKTDLTIDTAGYFGK